MTKLLKSRLAAGEPLIGTFVKTPSPMVCEVLGKTELDLVCLDAEHAPFDRLVLDQCLHALAAANRPALVRTPSAAREHILNALDSGASGVVVPHVTSAAEAEELVRAVHFGAGGRGYAGSTRAAGYTTKSMQMHLQESAASSVLVVQIEDVEALEAIDEIVAVEGVDCVFVGRVDLTVALGAASPDEPVVIEAVERICSSAVAAGRPVGMFIGNPGELDRWRAAGASLFLISSDHGFLLQGAARLTTEFRRAD